MRKHFLTVLLILSFTPVLYSQDKGQVSKRAIEKDKKIDTKTKYNYLLLDAVNNSDEAYSQYEELVQQVWDKRSDANLTETKNDILKDVSEYQNIVKKTPVYLGGNEYQQSVVSYLGSIKDKIEALEKLGLLGADENSDSEAYYKALSDFNDILNETGKLRNDVRMKKSAYEKIYYLEK